MKKQTLSRSAAQKIIANSTDSNQIIAIATGHDNKHITMQACQKLIRLLGYGASRKMVVKLASRFVGKKHETFRVIACEGPFIGRALLEDRDERNQKIAFEAAAKELLEKAALNAKEAAELAEIQAACDEDAVPATERVAS